MILGCKLKNEKIKNSPKHHSLEADIYGGTYKDHFRDDFYCNYDEFAGLTETNVIFKDPILANQAMNNVVCCVLKLLKCKLVISQDLLILCYMYCVSVEHDKSFDLFETFVNTIENVSYECLGSDNNNNKMKQRNYVWFKDYLLFSNL